jgi:hypothetical protein
MVTSYLGDSQKAGKHLRYASVHIISADSNQVVLVDVILGARLFAESLSISIASIAASFRSVCGSLRKPPECNRQRCPAETPQEGQRTEDNCLSVKSRILMRMRLLQERYKNRSIPHTSCLRTSKRPKTSGKPVQVLINAVVSMGRRNTQPEPTSC